MNTKEILAALCAADGVSGDECAAANAALALLHGYDEGAYIDALGSVHGVVGSAELPVLLLDAHIDEIGMTVSYIEDGGFLRAGLCGGVDRRLLPAQSVTVHGKRDIKGVITALPPHVHKDSKKCIEKENIVIDTGYGNEALREIVTLGDRITVDGGFCELSEGRFCGKALDDRAGVAAILLALSLCRGKRLRYRLAVTFTSQEETGGAGAAVSTFTEQPERAITVDVSYGISPGCDAKKCRPLSSGAMIGIAPILDAPFARELIRLAEKNEIPHTLEIMNGKTGTNADEITISRGGVKTALLSIPERYMHTPVEVVDAADIEAVARLIAAYVTEGENA